LTCKHTFSGGSAVGRCWLKRSAIFQPIHAVNPGKFFGDGSRLISLQRADEVPLQIKRYQSRQFGGGLLPIIFAEAPLTGGRYRNDIGHWMGFADGNQSNRA
jgi:hypothetical protein